MKKLVSLASAAVLALCLFSGCGGGPETADFEPADAAAALLESGAFTDILSPIDVRVAAELYGVAVEDIASCAVYCSTGATAEEIAIFRCSDANVAVQLEKTARTRLESQAAAYAAGYGPEEVPKIESADVRVSGVYVSCVVSNDNAAVAQVLDAYIK